MKVIERAGDGFVFIDGTLTDPVTDPALIDCRYDWGRAQPAKMPRRQIIIKPLISSNDSRPYCGVGKHFVSFIFPAFPIPNAVLIMFVAAIVAGLILSKTVLGRYDFAIGSNEEATRLSGVNVANWKTAIYALCGLFAGLAGVLMSARLNSAQPALGAGYELDAIAAVVIGGTSLSGGEGTILGTIIGAFVISTLSNGLRILSVPQEWQIVITGAIVIGAVYLDQLRRQKS